MRFQKLGALAERPRQAAGAYPAHNQASEVMARLKEEIHKIKTDFKDKRERAMRSLFAKA